MGIEVTRMKTGVKGLDELFEGGVPRNALVLVSGSPGTGKTILTLQMLVQGAKSGENCLFLSFEQPVKDILLQAKRFDWGADIDALVASGKLTLRFASMFDSPNLLEDFRMEVQEKKITRIVIDSLNAFQSYPYTLKKGSRIKSIIYAADPEAAGALDLESTKRLFIHYLFQLFRDFGANIFLIADVQEDSGISQDGISDFMCDGIIALHYLSIGATGGARSIEIRKMRWVSHLKGTFSYEINEKGIEISVSS
jgi:circadian clock protein KaiC